MNVFLRPEISAVQPQHTIAQAGPSQTDDNSSSSLSSSSESKGFIGTIIGGVKSAAQAVANFVVAAFKKVFCCFFGDSKEVKELKAQKETLVNFKAALEAFGKSKESEDYTQAIDALPEDMQKAFIFEIQTMMQEEFKGEFNSHATLAKFIFDKPDGRLVRFKKDPSNGADIVDSEGSRIIDQVTFPGHDKRLEAVDRMIQAIDLKLQK